MTPKKTEATACVVLRDDTALRWLGPRTILRWVMDELVEVRGVDVIFALTSTPAIAKTVKSQHDNVNVQVCPGLKDRRQDDSAVIHTVRDASDICLLIRPCLPFLPAAKMEACVRAVHRGVDTAYTIRDIVEAPPAGYIGHVCQEISENTQETNLYGKKYCVIKYGCRCLRKAPDVDAEKCSLVKRVAIDMIEALDVSDPEQYRVADALVRAGVV